jgi:hypothetical protein
LRIPPSELERLEALESLPPAARATIFGLTRRTGAPRDKVVLIEGAREDPFVSTVVGDGSARSKVLLR